MKTRRSGSRCCCRIFHRCRLRATSRRACSRANSVFFKAQPFAANEFPDRVVRDDDAAFCQFGFQTMQRQMQVLDEPFGNEAAMRLQKAFAVAADPVARWRCDHFTTEETATSKRAAAARQVSPFNTAATTRSRRSFDKGPAIRCWPPIQPASVNHNETNLGIREDSGKDGIACLMIILASVRQKKR